MNDQTLALLAELIRHSGDPTAFAKLRQKVLQSHFESVNPEHLPDLLTFQDQIEATNAVAGTPMRALNALQDDLINQCAVLDHVHQQLRDDENNGKE